MCNQSTSPSGWKKTKFRKVRTSLQNGGTPDTANRHYWTGSTPWITGADFGEWGVSEFRRYVSETAINSTSTNIVSAGNLLVVTRTGVGKIAIAPCDIAISQDITGVQLNPKTTNTKFFYYCMQKGVEELKKLNQGTSINGIVRSDLENYELMLPPIQEQKKIGEILSTIDAEIQNTEKLISKYQQIRAGIMHDLFTRGVDAYGRLRPPREQAPELYQDTIHGFFPNNWKRVTLGKVSEIVSGVTLGNKSEDHSSIEVPYLRVANVQDGYLDLSDVKLVKVSPKLCEKLLLQDGDVLMNEGGDYDKLGRGTVWKREIHPCIHQNHVFRVRPNTKRLRSEYLAYWSQSEFGKKYFILSSKQSTNLASINSTQLHAFPIMLPDREEQKRIELHIGAANDQLDQLADEMTKLEFIKSGLMHDLLTGRVRVKVLGDGPQEAAA